MFFRVLLAGAFLSLAAGTQAGAAEPSGKPGDAGGTDRPSWRAEHNPLLAVARAGNRLVVAGDRGIVLLSDDQGATWRDVKSGTGALLTAASFTSDTEGWVVGQDSTVLHTTDAGEHWTTQFTDAGADQALFSVASLGAGHLITTGSYNLILETENDGGTWTPGKIPNLDEDYHLNCVLPRGGDVVITGEEGHAFVRHAGKWTAMPVPYDGSQFGCLETKNGDIYSFGLRGSLFVSTAQAPAWKRIDTGDQRSIFGGTVLANGFLALVGSSGLAMLFDPQTNTIRKMQPPTGVALSAVAETSGGKWVLVGEDGLHVMDPAIASAGENGEMTQ